MTTYYVDATSGANGNTGLSDAQAWQTIAKVNGETFSANDNILFKQGETWNDAPLTPATSGAAGRPILFGAYGTGARPIIDRANLSVSLFINSKSYIRCEGLQFERDLTAAADCVYLIGTCSNITLSDCRVIGGNAGVFGDDNVSSVSVLNSEISDTQEDGIVCKGANALIDGCIVHDASLTVNDRGGIKINQAHGSGIIRNCTVYDCDSTDLCPGIAADLAAGAVLIENNEIYACSDGIYAYRCANITIRNNIIHDLTDRGNFLDAAIYLGDTSACNNCEVYHNTIYDVNYWGIFISAAQDCIIENNSFSGIVGRLLQCYNGDESTHTINYNIYEGAVNDNFYWIDTTYSNDWAAFRAASGAETNGINADPLLVNPGGGNFYLQAGSPCRDNGATGLPVYNDYDGVTRPKGRGPDIGAYEYNYIPSSRYGYSDIQPIPFSGMVRRG